jgi:hypothetical protein
MEKCRNNLICAVTDDHIVIWLVNKEGMLKKRNIFKKFDDDKITCCKYLVNRNMILMSFDPSFEIKMIKIPPKHVKGSEPVIYVQEL